jgi:hypothetical protein
MVPLACISLQNKERVQDSDVPLYKRVAGVGTLCSCYLLYVAFYQLHEMHSVGSAIDCKEIEIM